MKKRFMSLLIAGTMLASVSTLMPAQAVDKPDGYVSFIGILPDWTPMNFMEAMDLYNDHGKTYVADDYICIVRPVLREKMDDYGYKYGGSMLNVNTPAGVGPWYYEFEIPEKPDPSDKEAVAAYEDYCVLVGNGSMDYDYFTDNAEELSKYVFEVGMFHVLEDYDLTVRIYEKQDGESVDIEEFSFENKTGETVETDIYSWLPDCPREYNHFTDDNGRVGVYDNYIVYRSDVNTPAGEKVIMEQSGEGAIKEVKKAVTDGHYLNYHPDSPQNYMILYQPVSDGTVNVKWFDDKSSIGEETVLLEERTYVISDNGSVVLDRSPSRKGKTIFTFVDKDTGELIDISERRTNIILEEFKPGEVTDDEPYVVVSNPFTVNSIGAYSEDNSYSFYMKSNGGYYDYPEFKVTSDGNKCVEVTCSLKWSLSGDSNGDGEFGIADVLLLQKWLFSADDPAFANWKAADMCRDNTLNVFDLCRMKQKLAMKNTTTLVEPDSDYKQFYGNKMNVCVDELKVYLGPDEVYPVIDKLSNDTELMQMGTYVDESYYYYDGWTDENKWLFIEYDGKYGWIKMCQDDGRTLNAEYEPHITESRPTGTNSVLVQPEVRATISMFYISGDDHNMYYGPGTEYAVVDTISSNSWLYEEGYNKGDNNWVYAQNNGKYGWIKVYCDDGKKSNITFTTLAYDKPVIYLYPTEKTDVHVELELNTSYLATTYPKYNNGWDVTAYPDGKILNKADGTNHRYLFWDSTNVTTRFDLSKGFCVAGSDTERFLKEKLTYMGLTEEEMNEFIVYWLPRMEHNTYNLISFQGDAYTDSAKLDITPSPDSLLRVFMTYIPLENSVDIEPQQLDTFERNGFTVVEWGGSEIRA